MHNFGKKNLEVMRNATWYNAWTFSLISPYVSGSIIEIGGGIGNFTPLLLQKGDVTSIDTEKEYLSNIKKSTKDLVSVGLGDVEQGKYFFVQKTFNSAVCINVLEHINDHERALKNMYRLLKPKGNLCLLVPAHNLLFGKMDENLGHYRRYSKKSLSTIVRKAGFKSLKVRYLNALGALGWFINSRILKKEYVPEGQLKLFDLLSRPFLLLERFYEPPFGLSVLVIAKK